MVMISLVIKNCFKGSLFLYLIVMHCVSRFELFLTLNYSMIIKRLT